MNCKNRLFCGAALFLSLLSGPGLAICTKTAPAFAPIDEHASITERYRRLRAQQDWVDNELLTEDWRKLVAAMRADPKTPPLMLADALASLASQMAGKTRPEQLALAREAEAIVQKEGLADRPEHAFILTTLAFKELSNGNPATAQPIGEAAAAAARRHFGEKSWEFAWASTAAATTNYGLGRFEVANARMGDAARAAQQCLPEKDARIGDRLSSYAATLSMTGRIEEGTATYFRAANWSLANLPDGSETTRDVLVSLGGILRNTLRLAEAEVVLRRAIDLIVKYDADDWETRSDATGKLAGVLDMQGHHAEAEELWTRAEVMRAKGDDNRSDTTGAGDILRRAAGAAERRGDFALALKRKEDALALMKDAPADHPIKAQATIELAGTLLLVGRAKEALALARPAMAVLDAKLSDSDPKRIATGMTYARIVAATDGAEAGYAVAVPVEQKLRRLLLDSVQSRGDLIVFSPIFQPSFAWFADLALRTGRQAEAFEAVQLAAMSQIVVATTNTAARAAQVDPVARALVMQVQDGVRERRVLERERSLALSSKDAARAEQLDREIATHDTATRTAAATLDAKFPELRELGRPTPIALAEFQRHLAPGEVLLAPVVTVDGTLALAVTRDTVAWQKTAVTYAKIDALAARVRAGTGGARLETASFDTAAAAALYDAAVPTKLRVLVEANRSLLYFASGTLAGIPPALLTTRHSAAPLTKQPWLIRTHDVTVLPSLAPLPARTADATPPTRFLGVGAPDLGAVQLAQAGGDGGATRGLVLRGGGIEVDTLAKLPPLPNAAGELAAMARTLGGARDVVLTGAAARERAVRGQPLRDFAVLAFATHALTASAVGGMAEPALVVTPGALPANAASPDPADDGLLTASEIAGLRLDADWVILSACNTADGGGAGSPEYAGLAAAFVTAGARSLLVSHWPVRDDAAARLTVETVRGARAGETRAVALQRAMLRLMADRTLPGAAHPAVWAPFVLVGK